MTFWRKYEYFHYLSYTSAKRVCNFLQTHLLSITESKHLCFCKSAKIQYIEFAKLILNNKLHYRINKYIYLHV